MVRFGKFATRAAASALALATVVAGTPASAAALFTFKMSGDTAYDNWSLENTSTAGEKIVAFGFYLPDWAWFDPYDQPFAAQFGSDVTTGLVPPTIDGSVDRSLQLQFLGFDPGEIFTWKLDVDPGTVQGIGFVGQTVIGYFSDGTKVTGTLTQIPGDGAGVQFVAQAPAAVPEPATWAMMIAGFGLIGAGMRRRIMRVAFAA